MLSLLLVLHVACAAPLADDVLFQEGMRLYEAFDYEKAVFRFQAALRDDTRPPADRAVLFVWLGMTYAELGDWAGAERSFDDALVADARATLPADASPKIGNLFAQCLRRHQERMASGTSGPSGSPGAPTAGVATQGVASSTVASSGADAKRSRWLLWGGGAAAALGVVALGGGGAFGVAAATSRDEAVRAPFQDDAVRARDAFRSNQQVANTAFAVGASLVIAGAAAVIADLVGAGGTP